MKMMKQWVMRSLVLAVCIACSSLHAAALVNKIWPATDYGGHFLTNATAASARTYLGITAGTGGTNIVNFSDQFVVTNASDVSLAYGLITTNQTLGGNVMTPTLDVGATGGAINVDASRAVEWSARLSADMTIGFTNWSSDHNINLTITNLGNFALTVTNIASYIEVGSTTQPTNDWGNGIINVYSYRREGASIVGSRIGLNTSASAVSDNWAGSGTTNSLLRGIASINGLVVTNQVTLTGLTGSRVLAISAGKLVTDSFSSSVLANTMTDEDGTGRYVLDVDPYLTTPHLGNATAGSLDVTNTLTIRSAGLGKLLYTDIDSIARSVTIGGGLSFLGDTLSTNGTFGGGGSSDNWVASGTTNSILAGGGFLNYLDATNRIGVGTPSIAGQLLTLEADGLGANGIGGIYLSNNTPAVVGTAQMSPGILMSGKAVITTPTTNSQDVSGRFFFRPVSSSTVTRGKFVWQVATNNTAFPTSTEMTYDELGALQIGQSFAAPGGNITAGAGNAIGLSARSAMVSSQNGAMEFTTASGTARSTVQANLAQLSKTTNYTLAILDSGQQVNNAGSVTSTTNTLPTAVAGMQFGFQVDAAQTMSVKAGASDTISYGQATSATSGELISSGVNSTLWLYCPRATKWVVGRFSGAWTGSSSWTYLSGIGAVLSASKAMVTDALGNPSTAGSTTAGQIGFLSGLTSDVQSQMDLKAPLINANLVTPGVGDATGASLDITNSSKFQNLTASRALVSDGLKNITNSATTSAELAFVSGVTSSVQTQINAKQVKPLYTAGSAAQIASSTTEGTLLPSFAFLGTKTIAANKLIGGSTVRISLRGQMSSTATPTLRIKVKLNSLVVADSTAITLVSSTTRRTWDLSVIFRIDAPGTSAPLVAHGIFSYFAASNDLQSIDVPDVSLPISAVTFIDTTIAQTIDVTGTWGTAHGLNDIATYEAMIETLN